MKKFVYSDFISRNWLFINNDLQLKIRKTGLTFLGCGLGSFVAESMTRIGFENFIFVDGDRAELTNLNRQNFLISDLGKYKVLALSKRLKKINPDLRIKLDKNYIRVDSVANCIKNSNIIISTVDISDIYFEIIRTSIAQKKCVILPFNVGFGSLVIFINNTKAMQVFVERYGDCRSDLELLLRLLSVHKEDLRLPDYLKSNLGKIQEGIKNANINPQLALSSFLTASLVTTKTINYIESGFVESYPKVNYIDLF